MRVIKKESKIELSEDSKSKNIPSSEAFFFSKDNEFNNKIQCLHGFNFQGDDSKFI